MTIRDHATEPMVYALRRPACGHLVAVCVDDDDTKAETARFVADGVRRGFAVERLTVVAVREATDWCQTTCPHRPKRRAQR